VTGGLHRDDELIGAAQAGDRAAIEALLERYQERVFGFGLRMCGDSEDAKDVLQDTLLAAARTVGKFRGDSSVSTWLYTIARSFCIKKRRRGKYAPAEETSLDRVTLALPSALPGPDELAARGEVKRGLATALEALDASSREILILRDIEGLTAREVADVTGASVDAIKSRLHRARATVRERLAAVLGEAPQPRGPGCPDVLAAFSNQLEGDLEPRLCAELQEHIGGCAACRVTCDSLKRTLAVCASATAGPVPDAVRDAVRAALRAALQSPPASARPR
jgi:RNA polymerase sigma-70 factor (ECF subfamily)